MVNDSFLMKENTMRKLIINCLKAGKADCASRHNIQDLEGFQKLVEREILGLIHMHMHTGMEARHRGSETRQLFHLEVVNVIPCEK